MFVLLTVRRYRSKALENVQSKQNVAMAGWGGIDDVIIGLSGLL